MMRVKLIMLAVALLVFKASCHRDHDHLGDEQRKKINENKEACIKESGVDRNVIENIMKTKVYPDDDGTIDCFSACMMKKRGIMDDAGNVNVEVWRSKLSDMKKDQAKVDEIINKCKDLRGDTLCKTGGLLSKCVYENYN